MRSLIWLAVLTACTGPVNDEPIDTESDTVVVDTDIVDTNTNTDTDTQGESGLPAIDPTDVLVSDLQLGGLSLFTEVTLLGVVVTARVDHGVFVQEPGGGAWNGLWIATPTPPAEMVRGAVLDATGLVGWDFDRTQLDADAADLVLTGDVVDVTIDTVPLATLANPAVAEAWEGCLVRVDDLTAAGMDPDGKGFRLTTDGAPLLVAPDLYDAGAVAEGDHFEALIAAFDYASGEYRLLPRDAADVVGQAPATP